MVFSTLVIFSPLSIFSSYAKKSGGKKNSPTSPAGFSVAIHVNPTHLEQFKFDVQNEKLDLNEVPAIHYVLIGENEKKLENIKVDSFDQDRWQEISGRHQFLLQFYYANSRSLSRAHKQWVACYTGSPARVIGTLFNKNDARNKLKGVDRLAFSVSDDGLMMGVQFHLNQAIPNGLAKGKHFFRMEHCTQSGKHGQLAGLDLNLNTAARLQTAERLPASSFEADYILDGAASRTPAQADQELAKLGFQSTDVVKGNTTGITFKLKSDYPTQAGGAEHLNRPWKEMNLRDEVESEKFTLLVLSYFLKSMVHDPKNVNNNFIPKNSPTSTYWCHMPWLNQGNSRREAIHGLTQERPMAVSSMYPNATRGSNWGIGFYNAEGCQTIGRIFGTGDNPKPKPDWQKGVTWNDGTVSIKTLFTTSKFDTLNGAFVWQANVSEPNSSTRQVKDVSMVQIDIAVKDSTLKGTRPEINHWMMSTNYYDPTYSMIEHAKRLNYLETIRPYISKMLDSKDNPLPRFAGIFRMRPIGIQTGHEAPNGTVDSDSYIFPGSLTNQVEGRVNGPADNPKSSCLSCHATAGTGVAMSPGFMTNQSAADYVGKTRFMDYSQQLALAKRNYETREKEF
jgi:hypothetical protein